MNPTDARSDAATGHVPGRPSGHPARRPRRLLARTAALAAGTLLTVLAAPSAASAHPSNTSSNTSRTCTNGAYTVVRGDGWSIIARKLGTTTRALVAANGATTRTVVHPGQTLCAPAGATTASGSASSSGATATSGASGSAASCGTGTYTIVRGDGWLAIAKKLGVTSQALLSANKASVSTALFPGRTLCVPAGAQAPASAGTTPTATPVKTFTAAESEAIIRAAWPDELEEEALRIARRESNLRNTAKNWCCYGLFQIHFNAHKSWLATIGVTSANQLLDPTVNANAAYVLYQRAGSFRPWAV